MLSKTGRGGAALLAAAALLCVATPSAEAARPLHIGFFDSVFGQADNAAPWLDRTVALAGDVVRIDIGWPVPGGTTRPAGFDARDPADPHYDFARADAAIAAARSRGLQVLASFTGAPEWADGAGRPEEVRPGTWKPSPKALEDYGAALAKRYSGRFPDPAHPGHTLPNVKALQVWNEPNLATYLNPQWKGRVANSPLLYRQMLDAFYRGVKSAGTKIAVVTAGTGPFGDSQPGGRRVQPARFWRELLCLRETKSRLRGVACPNPARFDILAHHPYSVGRPRRAARNADDVSIPDIGKLTRLLRKAEATGRALPHKRHAVWVTELSYDSKPPDPQGVPSATHARWLQEAFYLLWRQGVDTITWFQVGDQPPVPSYAASNQSGVYFADGRPKLAASAFRFPLVAERSGRTKLRVWGRSPLAGTLTIERQTGGVWRTLRTLKVARNATFLASVARATAPDRLRARVAGATSLVWRAA